MLDPAAVVVPAAVVDPAAVLDSHVVLDRGCLTHVGTGRLTGRE